MIMPDKENPRADERRRNMKNVLRIFAAVLAVMLLTVPAFAEETARPGITAHKANGIVIDGNLADWNLDSPAVVDDAAQMVREYALTCQLFNLNGTPITITNTLNNLQADAEAERLGVPMVFTSDREYNSFGGYIDKAHEGFGTANDPELAYELACFYGKAMRAVGIHVTFEPYAEEIGAQYGENPEYIAAIVHEEIKGLEENGLASCTKHWIGRGGDSAFGKARSVAQNFENWMVGWKAALSAGSEWVMTNCGGTGITNTVDVKWDKATMNYLRNEIDLGNGKKGFDGVVVTDWWALGGGPSNPGRMSGITTEGVDLGQQTIGWLYNEALANGTDMFGSGSMIRDYSNWESSPSSNYPQAIIDGLATGEVETAPSPPSTPSRTPTR